MKMPGCGIIATTDLFLLEKYQDYQFESWYHDGRNHHRNSLNEFMMLDYTVEEQ